MEPPNIDEVLCAKSLELNDTQMSQEIYRRLRMGDVTPEQLHQVDNRINQYMDRQHPNNPYRYHNGELHNVGNPPPQTQLNWGNIILTGIIFGAGIIFIVRNWDYFSEFFYTSVETGIVNNQIHFTIARRIAFVAQNHPEIIRDIYMILRRH